MNKKEVKNILISLRTHENDSIVNNLLGKMDLMDEKTINSYIEQIGDKENIIKYFEEIINKEQKLLENKHDPINEMFTYGITGNCIHLHLPGKLNEMIKEKGILATIDSVNLQLIDALDKIRQLKENRFYKFNDKNSIFMISPVLIGKELEFLEGLDFKTQLFTAKQLKNHDFVKENKDARLGIEIFGDTKNIGTASIDIDRLSTQEWQNKKNEKVKEFKEQGIERQR